VVRFCGFLAMVASAQLLKYINRPENAVSFRTALIFFPLSSQEMEGSLSKIKLWRGTTAGVSAPGTELPTGFQSIECQEN
jgi:hypothetical protein